MRNLERISIAINQWTFESYKLNDYLFLPTSKINELDSILMID
jgi:hypothetical protein